ncbi:hypothetical protein LAU42_01930 [Macrococcus armenti]|uniref:hypothetical protein n=1 Tax=Macrococcus armenti TaxID=2875764 RepID=UPI001CC9913C|nr:hypothetical protein [Macrococcus armenti]UBH22727.1 hypothetical protein LAU42_01930 [Macrococcus armenti]
MKRMKMLVLTLLLVLTACGNQNEKQQEKDTKPKVEVKVNPEKKSNDKKNNEKKTEESSTVEKSTESNETVVHIESNEEAQANHIDTNKYNQARDCLVNGNNNHQCHAIAETKEYSKAWNNLTNEGYNCKNGTCYQMTQHNVTQRKEIHVTQEVPSEAQPAVESSSEMPTTERPSTENVTSEAPSTEQKKPMDKKNESLESTTEGE